MQKIKAASELYIETEKKKREKAYLGNVHRAQETGAGGSPSPSPCLWDWDTCMRRSGGSKMGHRVVDEGQVPRAGGGRGLSFLAGADAQHRLWACWGEKGITVNAKQNILCCFLAV